MSEADMVDLLREALGVWAEDQIEGMTPDEEVDVRGTFEETMLMTSNKGLVVRVGDSEFQVTVVRSK